MKIGYARVSTEEQNLDLQIRALERYGCSKIFTDHGASGLNHERQGLGRALSALKSGSRLVVWRLDRLGRSLKHLIETVSMLKKNGVEFVSLCENIDTESPSGVFMFHMIGALAEFERALISERTRAGMAAAKQRGIRLGRPSHQKQLATQGAPIMDSQFAAPRYDWQFHLNCKKILKGVKGCDCERPGSCDLQVSAVHKLPRRRIEQCVHGEF